MVWEKQLVMGFFDGNTQASVLSFIEDNWGLGRLGHQSFDDGSGSLFGVFDFRAPRKDKLLSDPSTGLLMK